jgi:hypothetical protein
MLKGGLGDFIGLHYTDTTIGETRQQPNGCLLWTVRGNWPATGCRVNRQPGILTAVCSRHIASPLFGGSFDIRFLHLESAR